MAVPPKAGVASAPIIETAAPDMLPSKPVEKTSLAQRNNAPDEVTLRFARWHAHGSTAYQRGEFAGFRTGVAQRLIASGVAILADTPAPATRGVAVDRVLAQPSRDVLAQPSRDYVTK